MTFLDVLEGLGSLLLLIVGVTVFYMLAKGVWLLMTRSAQGIGRFARDAVRNPRQAVVDAPFVIQLLLLPFLLAWERWYKWRHPEEARRNNAIFKKIDTAAKVFQNRLGQVALYREADEAIQFEERRGDCVMWVPMHPNPWRIQFSHGHLLRWWTARRDAIS